HNARGHTRRAAQSRIVANSGPGVMVLCAFRRPPGSRQAPSGAGLFDLDAGAGLLELGLDRVGLGAGNRLAHRLGRTVYQVLRLLETEAGDLAYRLDHVDLRAAWACEDDGELGLLLGSRFSAAVGAPGRRCRDRH